VPAFACSSFFFPDLLFVLDELFERCDTLLQVLSGLVVLLLELLQLLLQGSQFVVHLLVGRE
jgi:hypothetical protein